MKHLTTTFDADRFDVPLGRVHVIADRCKGCGYCIKYCPVNALKVSEELNKDGYHPPETTENACVDCGLCERICPEFAVWSTLEGYVNQGKVVSDDNGNE
jgi:2-oxoglutarate ferredoxin oxidoreductase subunit delta